MKRALTAMALAATFMLVPTPAMAADEKPLASEPGVHEVLPRAPSAVVLAFAWTIDSDIARIYVLDPKGKNITSAAPETEGTNVSVPLGFDLKRGTYSVYYQVNDRDGGPVGGAYQFAVSKGVWTKLKTPATWSGIDEQPAMFKGLNPNQPAAKGDPTEPAATAKPGLEVVNEDGTVQHFENKTKDDKGSGSGGSKVPWIIGGGLALLAAGLTAFGLIRRRNAAPTSTGKRVKDSSSDS